MKQNESIVNLMTKTLITVTPLSGLREVATIFAEKNVHHIPVVEGKKLVGIIAYSDLLRLSFADAFNQKRENVLAYLDASVSITKVINKNVKIMNEKGTIKEAAKMLCQGDFHATCIVNDADELTGIVTSTDIIQYLLDLY